MSASSHEESNAEDVDDLDNLVDGHAVEQDNEEQADVVEVEGEGNPDDEAQEVPARADPKPKRVIKNPQPKLNAETLKGPRGIHTLPQVFEKVKFKGKGYEEQDLNLLMKTYEYWCHRLFPKFSFDDCLARIEKLGTKKAVLTHVKKIRYDLLVEETPQLVSDNEEADVADEFDEIARPLDEPIQLTEDQQERIRLNKEKALRRLQDAKNAAAVHLPTGQSNLENSELNFEATDATTIEVSNERRLNSKVDVLAESDVETVEHLENSELNSAATHVTTIDVSDERRQNSETNMLTESEIETVENYKGINVFESEANAMETNEVKDPNTTEANKDFTCEENANLDDESAKENNDEDEEMDIESMLDVIAKGP